MRMVVEMPTRLKKNGIILEELWQVGVPESTNKYDILILVRVLSFQRSSHDENGLEGTHAKVIVILLGQLLGAQLVHLSHLLRKVLGRLKTLGV